MNTEQFWQGEFGDKYTERNVDLVKNSWGMFYDVFREGDEHFGDKYHDGIKSIIEFGAGSGQNILVLQKIFSDAEYTAIEINDKALKELKKIDDLKVINSSILNFPYAIKADLVLSKGLLIHIHPDNIYNAYEELYKASNKYILLCEYYSPNRIMIPYRGKKDKLWKFDFVKPMLDKGCKILDYGFVSKYDEYFQDDITWVLFQKK